MGSVGFWVKNLSDGQVEAVFKGEKEKMINWAKKGSLGAMVTHLDLIWEEYKRIGKKDRLWQPKKEPREIKLQCQKRITLKERPFSNVQGFYLKKEMKKK